MKQTAVEWLEKEIKNISIQVFDGFLTFIEFMEEHEKLCKQAKEMEKQQSNKLLNVIKDSREKLDAEVPFGESDSYDVMV